MNPLDAHLDGFVYRVGEAWYCVKWGCPIDYPSHGCAHVRLDPQAKPRRRQGVEPVPLTLKPRRSAPTRAKGSLAQRARRKPTVD